MIKFGTDGWRAIISEEFTFANLRKVAYAIALYLKDKKIGNNPIIVGYDARFLADKFAREAVKILLANDVSCLLAESDLPTPVVAWSVKDKKTAGAIMLTASHNPARYLGIKFIPGYAGPATSDVTKKIEEFLARVEKSGVPAFDRLGHEIERFNPKKRYLEYIKQFINPGTLKKARLKVVCDPLYSSGRGYLDRLLQDLGCETTEIHAYRDVLFGGGNPDPCEEFLGPLKEEVLRNKAAVGLANDGDADRFGIIDEKGNFLNPNQVIALLFDYLITDRGLKGSVVRSVATTSMVDKIASAHKIKVHETPVGFKHIAAIMMKEDVIIGGEESGGLSILGHIPEKDGILAGLLVAEMIARKKKPLSEIYQDLVAKIGPFYQRRINLHFTDEKKKALMKSLKDNPPERLAGLKVVEVNALDGVKLILEDGSWVLARPSGTEPVIRLYFEAHQENKIENLIKAIQS